MPLASPASAGSPRGQAVTAAGRWAMSGVGQLVLSGPLLFAVPVAAAAGAVTFLSPCVLPLVPGYLSYVTGMSGVDAQPVADAETAPASAPASGAGAAGQGQTAVAEGQTAVAVTTVAASAPAGSRRRPAKRRAAARTALFVLGFSAAFATAAV